jgi:hypothetical protein
LAVSSALGFSGAPLRRVRPSRLLLAQSPSKLPGFPAVTGNAEGSIVLEPAASTALHDRDDVIRFPEPRRVPAVDQSVAAGNELGAHTLPASGVEIRGFAVLARPKLASFGSDPQPIDDAQQLLGVEPARSAHALVAAINDPLNVIARNTDPKFVRAFVGTPRDAAPI